MKNIKAVFFDLDDTLINYGGNTIKSWEKTCKDLVDGLSLDLDFKLIAKQIILRNEEVWANEITSKKARENLIESRKAVVTTALNDLNIFDQEKLTYLLENYNINKQELVAVFDGVYDLLTLLKQKDYKLALITNGASTIQRGKLLRFDLEKYFDLILIEGEQPYGKPDKRIYQDALKYFNLEPEQAVMIGDHYLWEVVAPKEIGLKSVWHNLYNKELEPNDNVQPDVIINEMKNLINYFD
ncbi:HAD family hydrolase [Culicoidibacter larvae]|uniref:HAD family hydrolase n=1 Tax=Culicoidibacter larvae TaxID=2579976 RepID=A0A5R8QE02_9FIRM|nr:HAD family hydrolase [Culicoidibacter larvae]TLG75471.1 HAD family hydrolase [Culicoidibacter larvae]